MKQPKAKVLIIRCGRLGDTVGTTAVVKPIEEYYKNNVSIDWVTKPPDKRFIQIRHCNQPSIYSIYLFTLII